MVLAPAVIPSAKILEALTSPEAVILETAFWCTWLAILWIKLVKVRIVASQLARVLEERGVSHCPFCNQPWKADAPDCPLRRALG